LPGERDDICFYHSRSLLQPVTAVLVQRKPVNWALMMCRRAPDMCYLSVIQLSSGRNVYQRSADLCLSLHWIGQRSTVSISTSVKLSVEMQLQSPAYRYSDKRRLLGLYLLRAIMAAVYNRHAGHYIFRTCGFFLLFLFSSPNLSRRRLDVYHPQSCGLVRI